MKSLLRSPFVSAAVGGVAVAGVFLALGVTGRRTITTVIGEAPLTADRASATTTGLTPFEIYQHDAASVVFVTADMDQTVANPFDLTAGVGSGISTGSGFVIDRRGDIITNYHVVAGADGAGISVGFEHGVMKTAVVVGEDPNHDLAMLRVPARGLHLRPLELGDSATARVGDPTLSIGNPFGLDRTLTTGIVSALQRQITASSGFTINNVIQTDAALNPGSSGGPLIDATGRVIGINSQILTSEGGDTAVGLGFAVPINTVRALFPRLKGAVVAAPGYLGLAGVTVDRSLAAVGVEARQGVLVQSVDPAGPAARVGLHGGDTKRVVNGQRIYLGGDVIERIDGAAATSANGLSRLVASKRAGQVVKLTILRGGTLKSIDVMLQPGPGTK